MFSVYPLQLYFFYSFPIKTSVILHHFSLTPTSFYFLSLTPAIIRFHLVSHPRSSSFLSLHLSSTYLLHPITLDHVYICGKRGSGSLPSTLSFTSLSLLSTLSLQFLLPSHLRFIFISPALLQFLRLHPSISPRFRLPLHYSHSISATRSVFTVPSSLPPSTSIFSCLFHHSFHLLPLHPRCLHLAPPSFFVLHLFVFSIHLSIISISFPAFTLYLTTSWTLLIYFFHFRSISLPLYVSTYSIYSSAS